MNNYLDATKFVAGLLDALPVVIADSWSTVKNLDESCLLEVLSLNKIAVQFEKQLEKDAAFRKYFFNAFPRIRVFYENLNAKISRDSFEFNHIRSRFSEKNMEFILIKSDGSFPHESDNIDVLVKPEMLERVAKILNDAGYSEIAQVREPHKFLFRKRSEFDLLPLHIHTRVEWEGTQFIDSQDLWRRKEISDTRDYFVPSPEDCILITAAHLFFENHEVKLADLWKLASRIEVYSIDWDYIFDHARRLCWDDALVLAMLLMDLAYSSLRGKSMLPPEVFTKIDGANYCHNHLFQKVIKPSFSGAKPLEIPYAVAVLFFLRRIICEPGLSLIGRLNHASWIASDIARRRLRPF